MKVSVKQFATLKQDAGQAPIEVELVPGATVSDLLSTLGIKEDDVGILIVSGKQGTFGQELKNDDLVTLIPHIGGG